MEKNFDNEVYTLCYNSLDVFKNKKDAIKFYNECYLMSEGAEQSRYASILFDLNNNKTIALDNVSNGCNDICILTSGYFESPLKVNLINKLSVFDSIKYYKEKILPVLDVCNEENIRFDCRIPFEDYGSDNDINMKNLTNLYSKILNKRNVDFNDIYTNEICDGKYNLKGLPAVYAAEEEAQTLIIYMKDQVTGLQVELLYGVLPEYDVITRSAKVINTEEDKIRLTKESEKNYE